MTSDEEHLLNQVRNCLKTDLPAAKSWMIFAKSVYPQSFPVLFQCYKLECDEKNVTESALCLSDLIKKFPNEIILLRELRNIATTLCTETDSFSRKLFEQLSEDTKYEIMLIVTRNAQTIEEHCELMLLFLKRMPNVRFMQHSSTIIETLLSAEDQPGMYIPINLFRKMLVCDALPLILRASKFEYKFKAIFQLIQKAIEFYVCCMFKTPTVQEAAIRKEVILLSDNNPNEGWKPLLKLLETVAVRYRWNYPQMFVANDLSLQQLISLLKRKNKTLLNLNSDKHRREETSGFEEAYFCLVVTFFYYLYTFGRCIHSKIFSNSITGPYNYILMEGISFPSEHCSKNVTGEYKRTEKGFITVSKFASEDTTNMLITSFITAVECWESLHQHQLLMKEFKMLCKNIQLDTWPVFQEFYINILMYERAHREAIEHLLRIKDASIEPSHKNKACLQIASCYHYIGDYEHSLKILFDVVKNLPQNSTNASMNSLNKCPSRFMYFMGYNNREIVYYCVTMLLKLYKCKDRVDDTYKDIKLGYMLILMQYDLDCEYETLNKCIDIIKKAKSFCFQKFFNYIINVTILEEISYLATPAGGNVNLEILSTPTFQASKQRAVTRGINKGARDDLKQAFLNQMGRCYDNLDNLFIEFIKEEYNFLLLPLNE